jgi:histidine ammonia-lyase
MYSVCVQTGVDQATLSRFLAGKSGLSLESVDKLVEFLELEITPRKRKDN